MVIYPSIRGQIWVPFAVRRSDPSTPSILLYTCCILDVYLFYTWFILVLYLFYTCFILVVYLLYTCCILAVYLLYTCCMWYRWKLGLVILWFIVNMTSCINPMYDSYHFGRIVIHTWYSYPLVLRSNWQTLPCGIFFIRKDTVLENHWTKLMFFQNQNNHRGLNEN
jgi:hypothetical protein